MKRAEVAKARIVHEVAEAARRAKDEPREREVAETVLRAVEDSPQRERKETRAVPKSGIVRSRGTARMIWGVLSTSDHRRDRKHDRFWRRRLHDTARQSR